jgi:uncharacterized protein (TIGR02594 family)
MKEYPWMQIARSKLGIHEIPGPGAEAFIVECLKSTTLPAPYNRTDATAWCAAFLNRILQLGGIKTINSARARDWLEWGREPTDDEFGPGVVVILERGEDSGHVGFLEDWDDTRVKLLGGNQGDAVSEAWFPMTRVLGWRIPADTPAVKAPAKTDIEDEELALARERLPIFQAAADAYEWPEEVEAVMFKTIGAEWMKYVLMGIDSRESRFGVLLDEDGLGDGGHGHGEMQIDDRSHKAFCASGRWRDLAASLEYVHANVIIPSFNYLADYFELVGEDYERLFWAAIAGYNAGPGNVRKALEAGADPDSVTTGRDYSWDVRAKAAALKEVLG